MDRRNSRNQVVVKTTSPQKGRESEARTYRLGNAKRPFKRREPWRITHSVAVMNGRRFGNAFTPSSSSSFLLLLLLRSPPPSPPPLTAASLLCCFLVTPFFAPRHVHTRGLHQARLSLLEGKMTSWPFLTGQREEMRPHASVRSLVLPSCSRAGRSCRVDLRGPREFPFKETKKKKRKHHFSFLSSSPASSNLSDLPRFLMPLPIPGSTLRL